MTTPHQHVYRSTTVGTMITQQELIPTATMAPTISTQSRMIVIFVIMDYTFTEQGEDFKENTHQRGNSAHQSTSV